MTITNIQNRILLLILWGWFYTLIAVTYVNFISPMYSYAGLVTHPVSTLASVSGAVISMLPVLIMPIHFKRPSDFASWILYLITVGPCPQVTLQILDREWFALQFSGFIMLLFILFEIARRQPYFRITRPVVSKELFLKLMPLAGLLISLLVWSQNDFQIKLSFDDIYVRRLSARAIVVGGSGLAYILAILRGCLIPLIIVLGFYHRRKSLFLLAAFMSVVIFSFDGSRVSIFVPLLVVLVLFMTAKTNHNQGIILLTGACVVISVTIIIKMTTGSIFLLNALVSRLLIIPSQIGAYYGDFFSQHQYIYLTDGLLSRFIAPRYDLSLPHLIGREYFSSSVTSANTGIWPSGFAHFGYLGAALVSIIAGLTMRFIDSISKMNRFMLGSAACTVIAFTWSQVSLHTSILSNGIGVLLLAIVLMPNSAVPTYLRRFY